MSHDIDALLTAARSGAEITVPAGWGQGRATLGGLVGGALVARALGELDADATWLRSVTVNFVAPAVTGPARLETEILRQGKSATQVEVRFVQAEGDAAPTVRAVALLAFGAPRSSAVEVVPAAAKRGGDVESYEPVPYVEGMAPEFIGRVDLRPVTGSFPFTGGLSGDLTGYMRFKERTDEFGLAHLVALTDAWPPAPAQMLSAPAAVATMTWTMEFLAPVSTDPTIAWWYDVVTDAAHDGYAHTEARIADADGRVVAISRQTIALFG